MSRLRCDIYTALAEALAEPPEWLALPGGKWPLCAAAERLARGSESARHAAGAMHKIGAESWKEREERYAALIRRLDRTCLCLYESGALHRRLLGPVTFEVEELYRTAGLQMADAEMADHVSVELAFLAFLAENEGSSSKERGFIAAHAGRWMPALGRAIADSGDPVYAPIGRLLAEWLGETDQQPQPKVRPAAVNPQRISKTRRQAGMIQVETCTLCGFCVPVCPEAALTIQEDERVTRLMIAPGRCSGCGRCVRSCETGTLQMIEKAACAVPEKSWVTLRESPRGICPGCGAAFASQAELAFIAKQLGHPVWLGFCPDCRPVYLTR